MVKTQIDI